MHASSIADKSTLIGSHQKKLARVFTEKSNTHSLLARLQLILFYQKTTAVADMARFTATNITIIDKKKLKLSANLIEPSHDEGTLESCCCFVI